MTKLFALLLLLPGARGSDNECNGFDEMWGTCPDLPACNQCTPVDCQFGDWGSWYDSSTDCTGLRFRSRNISIPNNECGRPCEGSKIESQEHLKKECMVVPKDCTLTDWSEWTACNEDVGQVYRNRAIFSPPSDMGVPCTGNTEETKPCGAGPKPESCEFTDWQEWTQCSAVCGTGRHTRMRRVKSEARHSGETCVGSTLETKACEATEACGGADCTLGDWGAWSMCDSEQHPQMYRQRSILQAASGVGRRCNQTLKETQGCPVRKAEHCVLTEWSEWSALDWREPNPPRCNKECGGGQAVRTRAMQWPPSHGGSCPENSLRELRPCSQQPCNSPCELSDWSEWSVCSVECGKGTSTRKRSLADPAAAAFSEGCQGAMQEALPCLGKNGACPHKDCEWGEWQEWTECTASCGGGLRRRSRGINTLPQGEGAACPAMTKSEVSPCNLQFCGEACVDGAWGDWQEWEPCTATCSSALSVRSRSIMQAPNACGQPAVGVRHEYKACAHLPPCIPDQDCVLSSWGEWSVCSASCHGVHERNRFVKVFPSGNGKHCNMTGLKETAPCHPAQGEVTPAECQLPGPSDCVLSFWSDWSDCSKSCGGGQRERRRRVLTLPAHGGKSCNGELMAVGPCNPQLCKAEQCVGCVWGEWSEWGDCDKCMGHKYRHRSIEQMPNHCGKQCDLRSAKEVTNCTGNCDAALVCAWTEWSFPSGCNTGCGTGTMMRSRALSLLPDKGNGLFQATSASRCLGAQLNMSSCPSKQPCTPPCVPQDCSFAEWGPWSQPAQTGLCERHRNVKESNNECGQPCDGTMAETKICVVPTSGRRDCGLSDWTLWSQCKMNGNSGQRHRERYVNQQPTFDGQPCEASLHETQLCGIQEPVNCMLSEWSMWGDCERTCGGGWHHRARTVLSNAQNGGKLCEESLQEMKMCNAEPCYEPQKDCTYSEWSSWSGCGAHGQRYRERRVSEFAVGSGQACEGNMEEMESCLETEPLDCEVSDWTHWDACDKTCGGGQVQRQRQIMVFPERGGKPCPMDLAQTMGCNKNPCNVEDCQVSEWQEWSVCSATCGPAHRQRQRQVRRGLHLRDANGKGCSLELSELAVCDTAACPKRGCEWGQWAEWSSCPVSCGGGQQARQRNITQMPEQGGLMCEVHKKEEVRPCGEQECAHDPCVDGLWSDWNEWSACSASCGGGTTFRMRRVAQMANFCGRAVEGDSQETKVCNAEVDCEPSVDCLFGDWEAWGECSQTCSGVMERKREIAQLGSGKGSFCQGHLSETSPCNPSPTEATPAECTEDPPTDCAMSEWSLWGQCSASCGGGEQARQRDVLTAPANGGKPCEGPLTIVRQCNSDRCPGPAPVDCSYGEWEDWGACAKCDGERTRVRHVTVYAAHGGKSCAPFAAAEASACPRQCHERQYCAWSDWAPWGDCTAKCGEGKRMRRRQLSLTTVPSAPPAPVTELLGMYSELHKQTVSMQASHQQELLMSFAGGFFSFVVALFGVRTCVATRQKQRAPRELSGVGLQALATGPAPYQHLQANQAASPLVSGSPIADRSDA